MRGLEVQRLKPVPWTGLQTKNFPNSLDFRSGQNWTFKLLFLDHLGHQVVVVGRNVHWGKAQAWLMSRECGRSLQDGRVVPEGTETSLLGEELLVGHGVDRMRERKRWAANRKKENTKLSRKIKITATCVWYVQVTAAYLQGMYQVTYRVHTRSTWYLQLLTGYIQLTTGSWQSTYQVTTGYLQVTAVYLLGVYKVCT